MNLDRLPLFALMREDMQWTSERMSVLAENVANADTPGYRARDLARPDFQQMLQNLRSADGGGELQVEQSEQAYEITLSGNSVVLDEQMMKVADTSTRYQLISGLYSKHIRLFKLALGGAR
ncbi:MAG: flagellar basal body protein [Alphaproteobacteria bacterium]